MIGVLEGCIDENGSGGVNSPSVLNVFTRVSLHALHCVR